MNHRNGNRNTRDFNRQTLPAFNVCLPFHHVIMVQMNLAFRDLLVSFFNDMCDDETPEEITAFRDALSDPSIFIFSKQFNKPTFLICEKYMRVIAVQMNVAMRDLICDFINNIDGVEDEIVAFGLALGNPHASLEIRLEKLYDEVHKHYSQGMNASEIAAQLRLSEMVIGCFIWEIEKQQQQQPVQEEEEAQCDVRRRKLTMA